MKKFVFCMIIILFNAQFFNPKENLFLFYHKEYLTIFQEKNKIYQTVKNRFSNQSYQIYEIKIKSFNQVQPEISKFIKAVPSGIIFIDDFLSPALIKNDSLFTEKKFRLITYNLPENYKLGVSIPTLNIILHNKNDESNPEKLINIAFDRKEFKDFLTSKTLENKISDLVIE
jgi:hypothetical protein